jgi:hypothetical protein
MINFGYTFSSGTFSMGGGTLSANALSINGGSFYQSGGTTRIAGDVTVSGLYNDPFNLSGGLLCDANTSIGYVYNHGFTQSGGTHIITNLLNITAGGTPATGYILTGGQLTVSNIQVNSGANFNQTGGTVTQSGTLTLANGNVYVGPGAQQFGRLQLINSGNTNSTFYMPSNACLSRFANSSGVAWSTEPTLCIEGWNGSLSGGGNHQIIFGNNAIALTAPQLDQLRFHNPAGLPAGCYLAKILSTGEIVPNAKTISAMSLKSQTNGAMRLQIQAVAGHTYQIDVSTNLVDWTFWTNQFTTNGTIQVLDTDATNYSRRFYRATLQP